MKDLSHLSDSLEAIKIRELLTRIQGEYNEMPGLRLTPAQAQRLWRMDHATCERLLSALVESRFLRRTRNGSFARAESAA